MQSPSVSNTQSRPKVDSGNYVVTRAMSFVQSHGRMRPLKFFLWSCGVYKGGSTFGDMFGLASSARSGAVHLHEGTYVQTSFSSAA